MTSLKNLFKSKANPLISLLIVLSLLNFLATIFVYSTGIKKFADINEIISNTRELCISGKASNDDLDSAAEKLYSDLEELSYFSSKLTHAVLTTCRAITADEKNFYAIDSLELEVLKEENQLKSGFRILLFVSVMTILLTILTLAIQGQERAGFSLHSSSDSILFRNGIFKGLLIATLCALTNFVLTTISGATKIPLYLDSIATIAAAFLGGLVPAILTAMLTNGLMSLINKAPYLFAICHIMTAIFSATVFYAAEKKNPKRITICAFLFAGLLSAISNGIAGSAMSIAFCGGRPDVFNRDMPSAGIYFVTQQFDLALYWAGIALNFADKTIAAVISFVVCKSSRIRQIFLQ